MQEVLDKYCVERQCMYGITDMLLWQAAWNAALEKAAKECETMNSEVFTSYGYADAIRALKEE